MLKPLLACLSLAALPAAAFSRPAPAAPTPWKVSGSESGCIAYTTLPQGTVVSVLAGAGQESLLFLVQDRGWESLRDGSRYDLAVTLEGGGDFKFNAVAKTELDSDGPGLIFAVPPGEKDGARFLAAFAQASGIAVGQQGHAMTSGRLSGGGMAMTQLAQCMSTLWSSGTASSSGAERQATIGAGKAIKL